MKKVILCSCLVAALLCCLIVPSFAANWFGGQSYSVSLHNKNLSDLSDLATFLTAVGATSTSTAVGTAQGYYSNSGTSTQLIGESLFVNPDTGNVCWALSDSHFPKVTRLQEFSFTSTSSAGLTEAQALGSDYTVTVSGSPGFVTTGFTSGLGIAGTVVNFCTSNTYVLIAIGLAVAVPLVGWGISKLKSLIKGY